MASWLQDAKIVKFDPENKIIEFAKSLNVDLVSLKDFRAKLAEISGFSWSVSISQDEISGKSVNDQLHEEVEKRKNEAINSPLVQKIRKEFEGTEILSVEEIS